MKITVRPASVARGHAFGRVGAGRGTYFRDRRREGRATDKVKLRKESGR